MGIFSTIRPSSPHGSTYAGYPEDMDDWNCAQWKYYYINNKAIEGQQQAQYYVENDMARVGSFADLGYCKYDCDFMDFFRNEGIQLESIYSTLFCGVSEVTGDTMEVIKNVTGSARSVTSLIIPIAIIGGGLWFADRQGYLNKYKKNL